MANSNNEREKRKILALTGKWPKGNICCTISILGFNHYLSNIQVNTLFLNGDYIGFANIALILIFPYGRLSVCFDQTWTVVVSRPYTYINHFRRTHAAWLISCFMSNKSLWFYLLFRWIIWTVFNWKAIKARVLCWKFSVAINSDRDVFGYCLFRNVMHTLNKPWCCFFFTFNESCTM